LTAGIPVAIIDALCDWYSKLHSAVRLNNVNSFIVGSRCIQGWCLFPDVISVLINVFIHRIRKLNTGCHVSGMLQGVYCADDITLISHSGNGLQEMLDQCVDISQVISLSFLPSRGRGANERVR